MSNLGIETFGVMSFSIMSFGIMLHSGLCCSACIWTYVVRDCVVQRNVYRLKVVWRNDVVRHNVVRRIVIWPTVGVS